MIDAEIELVVHPCRLDARQEIAAFVDKVVVVEQAAPGLRRLVARDHRIGDRQHRRRAVAASHGLAALDQHHQAIAFRVQPLAECRVALQQRFGDETRTPFEFLGEENRKIKIGALVRGRGGCGFEASGLLAIGFRSGAKQARRFAPLRNGQMRPIDHLRFDLLDGVIFIDCKCAAEFGDRRRDRTGTAGPGHHRVALADRLLDDLTEGMIAGGGDRSRERAAERALGRRGSIEQYTEALLIEELRLRRFVQHAKARGHVGFERELLQQPRAEGVDGLHL